MHSNYMSLVVASTVLCCYLVYRYLEMESNKKKNSGSVGGQPDSVPVDAEQSKMNRELVKKEREARRMAKVAGKHKAQDGNRDLKTSEKPLKVETKESPTKKSNKPLSSKDEKRKERKPSKSEHTNSDKIDSSFDKMVQYLKQLNIENPEMIVKDLEKLSLNEHNVPNVSSSVEDKSQSNPEKKELSKAERRAIQEAQRAAKMAKQNEKVLKKPSKKANETEDAKSEKQSKESTSRRTPTKKVQSAQQHRVKLFNHLYTDSRPYQLTFNDNIHPAIAQLGVQYSSGIVKGCNARGLAFMNAIKLVIKEYETPPQKEFSRSLEDVIKLYGVHLQHCRPLAVSVTNAMKFIQWQIRQLPKTDNDDEMKETLLDSIDTYVREQIDKAAESIRITVQNKISDGDVILTFGCSSVILNILMEATKSKRDFRVVIVDARPWHEGREMLRRLAANGIKSTCILINAVGFIMPEVTKVLLGAHALLANGYVMSRVGTAQIALLAKSYNVPVLVCCETHKFSERVQTDAFVYNEIGDPYDLVKTEEESPSPLVNWKSVPHLTPLNLYYDVTPPELVTAVVTEVAILPCTSVPVILREQILWS